MLQYNSRHAITVAVRGSSERKLYEQLRLKSLQLRRWYIKLSCFSEHLNREHPRYLIKLIPSRSSGSVTRNMHNIPFFKTRLISFFISTVIEWNKLDHKIRNTINSNIFWKSILKFIRLSANSFVTVIIPKKSKKSAWSKSLTRAQIQTQFSKFFKPVLLLHCPTYITERHTLLSTIGNIDNNLLDLSEPVLIKTLIFCSNLFDTNANTNVLNQLFYLLKDLKNRFFSAIKKFSNKVMNQ